ncbi:MAG: hypothetical protein LBH31_06930, partial [Burkholderiaceae bacterium]|nr:hypothetical protein [Burkholderiaceae bacterium]
TYGDPTLRGGALELRYVSTAEDVRVGDLLTTSGIDGVYPPGLPVARVLSVERPADASFARILCQPLAHLSGVTQVMVLAPVEQPSSIPPDMIGPHLSPQAQLPNEVSASAAVVAASAAVSATAAASATAAPVSSAPPRASVSATSVVGVTRTVREHSPRARVHLAPNVSRASASSRASTSANPGVSPNLNSANSSPPALDASADTGDSP